MALLDETTQLIFTSRDSLFENCFFDAALPAYGVKMFYALERALRFASDGVQFGTRTRSDFEPLYPIHASPLTNLFTGFTATGEVCVHVILPQYFNRWPISLSEFLNETVREMTSELQPRRGAWLLGLLADAAKAFPDDKEIAALFAVSTGQASPKQSKLAYGSGPIDPLKASWLAESIRALDRLEEKIDKTLSDMRERGFSVTAEDTLIGGMAEMNTLRMKILEQLGFEEPPWRVMEREESRRRRLAAEARLTQASQV